MSTVLIGIQRFAKQSFTENLGLKIIAAIVSGLLYLLVTFQEEAERIVDVQIIPPNPEQITGLVLANENELPGSVKVRLRGRASTVKSLAEDQISPYNIALPELKEGTHQYFFSEELFQQTFRDWPGLEFVRVIPESIPIRFEKLVSRSLPVRIRTYGKLKAGAEFAGEPTVKPNHVKAIGPSSLMRGLESVHTEDVDIDGLAVGEHVHIVPARPIEGISLRQADELKVRLKVRWIPGKRMISGLLVQVGGTDLSAECRPKEVAVALSGPQVALDNLDPSKIIPTVSIVEDQKNRLGIHRGEVKVENLPDDILVTSIAPKKVQVKLTLVGITKPKKPPAEP